MDVEKHFTEILVSCPMSLSWVLGRRAGNHSYLYLDHNLNIYKCSYEIASELMKKQMYKKCGMGCNEILEEIIKVFTLF